jgi:hypothetical protein
MNEEMKGFWKYFALLVAGAAINLAGGIVGKTTPGYILFFIGLAVVIAVFVFLFLKKEYFKSGRLKVLILGLILSLLLGASITLLLNNTFTRPTANASMFGGLAGNTRGAYNFGNGGTGSFRNNGTTGGFSGNTTSQNGSGTSSTTSSRFASARASSLAAVLLGWLFLAAGGILLIVTVIRVLTRKVSYAGDRWKVLLLGLLVGAMLSSSSAYLLTHRSFPAGFKPGQMMNGQVPSGTEPSANGTMMPPNGTPGAALQTQATLTVAPTETATPTPAPTGTTAPTATATIETVANLVVCLDYNQQVGENIRSFPSDTGTIVGTIPMADCFTIDGRNSQYPGWYHFASGQNGRGGRQISSYADENNLWVYNHHFDKAQSFLDTLAEVAVPAAK